MEAIIFIIFMAMGWSVYFMVVYIYSHRMPIKAKNFDSLLVVHKNCYSYNAKHIYLFKLFYGKTRKKFFFLSTIQLEFIDEKEKLILTVKIPPRALFESQKEGYKEVTKSRAKLLVFILQTKESLENAVSMRISHDCKVGDIFVYDFQIIDLITKNSCNSMVQSWIRYLPEGTHPRAQIYSCNISGRNMTDIKPTPFLNFPEIHLFFIFGLHYIIFHIQYVITSMEPKLEFTKSYEHISTMVLTALMSAFTGFSLTFFAIIVYYFLVKRIYSQMRGIGFIWIMKWAFLSVIVVMSFVFGLSAAFKPEESSDKDKDEDNSKDKDPTASNAGNSTTLKWFALILSIVIFTMEYFAFILCSHWSGCFKNAEEYDLFSKEDKSFKSVKTSSPSELRTDSTKRIGGAHTSAINESHRQGSSLTKHSKVSKEPIAKKSENDFKNIP